MAFQEVVIFGHTGNVGKELVRQIQKFDRIEDTPEHTHIAHENPTRIVGLANRSGYIVSHRGLRHIRELAGCACSPEDLTDRDKFNNLVDDDDRKAFKKYKATEGSSEDWLHLRFREVINAVKRDGLRGETVYVDATAAGSEGSENWAKMHTEVIESGDKLVTANKNPLALTNFETFKALVNDRQRYAFNATALAGGDAVRWLMEARHLSEWVYEVTGCFSGSLGYIASQLHFRDDSGDQRKFSEIVRDAMGRKYTEPDPRDDLGGLDVKRKLIILARSLGCDVGEDDFSSPDHRFVACGFIDPSDFPNATKVFKTELEIEDYLAAVEEECDSRMAEMVRKAESDGNVLRYVATLKMADGEPKIEVDSKKKEHPKPDSMEIRLKAVSESSELGRLNGSLNLIKIISDQRAPAKEGSDDQTPHIIKTKGAGTARTASAIRADMLGFLPRFTNADTFEA